MPTASTIAAAPPSASATKESSSAGHHWSFDDGEAGKLPPGWTAPTGDWRLEVAPGRGQILFQAAAGKDAQFNVALATDVAQDVNLTVKLHARAGRIDQGGGLVWRAKDERNYYVARYNPLEDNYRVYFVKDGHRKQLGSSTVSVDHQAWHELNVTMKGDHITCSLDGKALLDVRDGTFSDAGKVGLWTKADAQTEFDDMRAASLEASAAGSDGSGH